MDIESTVNRFVQNITAEIVESVKPQIASIVRDKIHESIAGIDIESIFAALMKTQTIEFRAGSIPTSAIDVSNLRISGDQVNSGIIRDFGSTGIDDKATQCQLSIFDDITVVENNLLSKDLTVKGTATIEGDLIVTGNVPKDTPLFQNLLKDTADLVRSTFDETVYSQYANFVTDKIKADGLDLTRILLNGQEVINGANLSNSITFSNLQKVGQLKELQVSGESLLSGSLYTTQKRVGINTIEPGQALSVWDQEVEIGFGKKAENTAVVGVPRNQTLILSSNGKKNITLTPDGEVSMTKINLEHVSITSGSQPPSNDQPIGTIMFNASPSIGGPIGWVSLGSARWANFGIID